MDRAPDNSFPSDERLKHKKLFEALFAKGNRQFKHPILAIWSECSLPEPVSIQAGFVAPKKHFKHAVDRNKVKRWMKEAFRLNKAYLESIVQDEGKQIAILFIAVGSDNISFEGIGHKMVLLLREIGKREHDK
jgi:ribonuclease P protein component